VIKLFPGDNMDYTIEELISAASLHQKVQEIGAQIEIDYAEADEIILVGLLRGSTVFMADLAREIDLDAKIDFMVVSSYGNSMNSSREVKIKKDLEEDIRGKHVIIVEDIIDTGYTLEKVREYLLLREPASLKICTLLDKPERREVNVPVDYTGFTIPDVFVIGYGIDYAQRHRNLPFVGKVIMNK
jgi:hypoxanthine phosphoribosyltransferase